METYLLLLILSVPVGMTTFICGYELYKCIKYFRKLELEERLVNEQYTQPGLT